MRVRVESCEPRQSQARFHVTYVAMLILYFFGIAVLLCLQLTLLLELVRHCSEECVSQVRCA